MLAVACAFLGTLESDQLIAGFVTPADHDAVQRHKRPLRRRQSLIGRALLRRMLEREAGLPRQVYSIDYDRDGRPAVRLRGPQLTIDTSVTHSRDRVLCAITAFGFVGIDIEYHSAHRAIERIAEASFGPSERLVVGAAGIPAFYRLWTLREAMAKALGGGLWQLPTHQDFFRPEPSEGLWQSQFGQHRWFFSHRVLRGDYSLAVALRLHTDICTAAAWETLHTLTQHSSAPE
jgi:4'-phosphopantetheinyl transferase